MHHTPSLKLMNSQSTYTVYPIHIEGPEYPGERATTKLFKIRKPGSARTSTRHFSMKLGFLRRCTSTSQAEGLFVFSQYQLGPTQISGGHIDHLYIISQDQSKLTLIHLVHTILIMMASSPLYHH